jgi:Transposase.
MPRYSEERKAAILKKLLPPNNKTISEIAAEEHISEAMLYNWRSKLRSEGKPEISQLFLEFISPKIPTRSRQLRNLAAFEALPEKHMIFDDESRLTS